ncbi:MAG: formylglycine-generating enzyme family protein, partial [Planctomycetota bacterium]
MLPRELPTAAKGTRRPHLSRLTVILAAAVVLIVAIGFMIALAASCRPSQETPAEAAARLGVPLRRSFLLGSGVPIELTLIPPGTFTMGDPVQPSPPRRLLSRVGLMRGVFLDGAVRPAHEVTISKAFYLGITEVTQAQWLALMPDNPSAFNDASDLPVDSVTFEECERFIELLGQATGHHFRLPTEAEWEHACRAGTTSAWSFGGGERYVEAHAWASGRPRPVAQKRPNPWGLFDIHGNAWEFCSDWLGPYPAGPQVDP